MNTSLTGRVEGARSTASDRWASHPLRASRPALRRIGAALSYLFPKHEQSTGALKDNSPPLLKTSSEGIRQFQGGAGAGKLIERCVENERCVTLFNFLTVS